MLGIDRIENETVARRRMIAARFFKVFPGEKTQPGEAPLKCIVRPAAIFASTENDHATQ